MRLCLGRMRGVLDGSGWRMVVLFEVRMMGGDGEDTEQSREMSD
jgi:hypothetical protein